jgi:iron complex outermembrane recepter protein
MMSQVSTSRQAMRKLLLAGVALSGMTASQAVVGAAYAQDQLEEIVVTGSRIARPNLTSASPVYSVGAEEIAQQQQPEIEKILRILPVTIPGDGDAVNNGTAGVASIDLRGLGPQRNLIMVDGKRLTPYNQDGVVDISQIPTALIERIDIVTGGASAVYGSDAISGAVNFILKKDFEGLDTNYRYSVTEKGDGDIHSGDVTMGANFADGRGNVVLSLNYNKRDGVLFGARPLGRLGIVTEDGSGLSEFKAGLPPAVPPAGCEGPSAVAVGGSSTTVPTRVAIAGGVALGQFRNDGSLGANCSVFNFNPFNFYQTPQERYGATALARYEINDHVEAYARFGYSGTNVKQQIAPSGVFGDTFFVPLANPFLSGQARQFIIDRANAGRLAGTVATSGIGLPNWRDLNSNGVVDAADDLLLSVRRRTVEFGPRSTAFDNNGFQALLGLRGDLIGDWNYDLSFQRGETDRTNLFAGYTNVANIANALNAVSRTECRNGDPACVPLNVFGGFGSITPDQVGYSSANALEKQNYRQTIASAVVSGPVEALQLPTAENPLAFSFGVEYRKEEAETQPDECLKLAPASCLGGNGGNMLPIKGGFDVKEFFAEAIVPLVNDAPFAKSLELETAVRYSDYDPTGTNTTWKVGANWAINDAFMFRSAQQRAVRAPNVNEIASPRRADLFNASLDPCSIANPQAVSGANATLIQRCISTGMTRAQVGTTENLVAGQINAFSGTDLNNLPEPEKADTTTVGFVVTPRFDSVITNPVLTLDYYRINIKDVIGFPAPQEVLDGCYLSSNQAAAAAACAKIRRVGGTLTLPGSGVELLTTNLVYLRTSGMELGVNFGVDLEELGAHESMGSLSFALNANLYFESESQSDKTTSVLDCLGVFGPNCPGGGGPGNPTPEFRFVQRLNWNMGDFSLGYTWRHIGSVEIEEKLKEPSDATGGTFDQFEKIKAYNYFDLNASYQVVENVRVSLNAVNIFKNNPPVVGNEAGQTSANSGNTFPSTYDTLGRIFTVGMNVRF